MQTPSDLTIDVAPWIRQTRVTLCVETDCAHNMYNTAGVDRAANCNLKSVEIGAEGKCRLYRRKPEI